MSDGGQSFLSKLKKALSRLFKGKKKAPTSFKTPQEIRASRQLASGLASPPRPIVAPPKPLEATRDASSVEAPRDESRLQAQAAASPPLPHRSLAAKAQDYGESADVSPTEPPTFRTDRPHSQAVSALEQEGVPDRIKKSDALSVETEAVDDRPISGITADEQHPVEPATDLARGQTTHERYSSEHEVARTQPVAAPAEHIEEHNTQEEENAFAVPIDAAEAQHEQATAEPPYINGDASDSGIAKGPEQQEEIPDRVDPLTAPEVVNRFDDEKVPVINEPNSPVANENNFRMSATSGPLEDFPAGGEYY